MLTGVRRSGKSSILAILRDEFLAKDPAARIIEMHFESMEYAELFSDLSTYLAGRYVEIGILPLSFSETLLFRRQYNTDAADKIVQDIYSSIVLRDIISRNNIRNVFPDMI